MDDIDKTIPPKRTSAPDGDDVTMPGKRDRKPDGRFVVGDLIMSRYKVLAELGQGGMGVVYKCFDETAGIEVALKALPPELSHNTLEMEDIKDNFQLVSKLVHQNIAISKNLEKDNSNGNYYLIMECCEGEDLRRWIKRKRKDGELKPDDVLPIIKQTAEALDYAHEMKIIHRDIKPGNIMIDQSGKIKVLDFGLAAQIHTSMIRVSMAYHGTSGTGPYMAPEQWRGRAQSAPADQYALAVMTYEMLAGHLPFESADPAVLQQAVLTQTPEDIPDVPQSVQKAIARAMSKEPAERFVCCADFVAALEGKKVKGAKITDGGGNIWKYLAFAAFAALAVMTGIYFFNDSTERSRGNVSPSDNTYTPAVSVDQTPFYDNSKSEFNGTVSLPNGVSLEMVKITAGTFMMGSPSSESGRWYYEKQHQVTLSKDYWLGKYEVTQAQWQAVMGNNPSYFKGDNRPVERVSWNEAKAFCEKLNERYAGKLPRGYKFDLPTEAQWEYACRAGTTTAYSYGDSSDTDKMNYDGNYPYGPGAVKGVHRKQTVDVGSLGYKNAWGLYDMHGNVEEWCRDWYGDYSNSAVTDPVGPQTGSYRVIRGGGWGHYARDCRSAYRDCGSPGDCLGNLGLRLALAPVQ